MGMPANISKVFEVIEKETIWLHEQWAIFGQLFFKSSERIDLLNKCASSFFALIGEVILNDMQLTLCKLTDPASTLTRAGTFDNLSLRQLQQRVKASEPKLAGRLKKLLKQLEVKCKPSRKWRDKFGAHLDLATATQKAPLPDITKKDIEESLEILRDYMNMIKEYYGDRISPYTPRINGDADELVNILGNGLRYKELFEEGIIPSDDLSHNQWRQNI
jgi:hypothetical protein